MTARPPHAPDLQVLWDADALAHSAAAWFASTAERAIAARGAFTVALAGGSTPRGAYQHLATELRDRIAWDAVSVYFGDERCVPPDHEGSNHAMAHEALLAHVPLPPANVHRMRGEVGPDAAAAAYEATMRAAFGAPGAPTFDLVLLGVGDDGHTASLFPGSDALDVTDRWVTTAASPDPDRPWPRVTLTFPALCGAAEVLVLAAGEGKREMVRGFNGKTPSWRALPVARVRGRERTVWMVDQAAAAWP